MEVPGINRTLTRLFDRVANSKCFNKATVVKTINISDQERMSLEPVSFKLNQGKKIKESEKKPTEIDSQKKMWSKKRKTAFKKHPITWSGKNNTPLRLQNPFFAVPVLIGRKSAQAVGRQRVKEMGQFVEQCSCLA